MAAATGDLTAIRESLVTVIGELNRRFPLPGRACYWHGGQDGLEVGKYILPPAVSGADAGWTRDGKGNDRVYITNARWLAWMYAAMHDSGGAVYRVKPLGNLTPGRRWGDGTTFAVVCDLARIVSAESLPAEFKPPLREAFQAFREVRCARMAAGLA